MDVVGITIPFLVLVFIVGIVALIVWTVQRGDVVLDLRQVYFYLIALTTLLIAFISALVMIEQIVTLFLTYSEADANISTQRQIASMLGLLLVAKPVWWFHWQHVRRQALRTQHYFGLRVYLYAIMIIALIVVVIVAGRVGTEIFKVLLGLVDFSKTESVRSFWRNELSALVNLFVAFAVWYYHWRTVERIPTTDH